METSTTIAAIATPAGVGAIAVVRLSGKDAFRITENLFKPSKRGLILSEQPGYTIHYGSVYDGSRAIDHVLVSIFRAPHSYTGEDVVEISCHGSVLIQQQLLELLVSQGATLAHPGEFTLRAFLNGKIDLSQAEAVADLIATSSEAARRVALEQIRGGFSTHLHSLREQLVNFISLIELELDFSEEDVEFADRSKLLSLVNSIKNHTKQLLDSFQLGNVIKNGIPVTIAGKPNVGKSTLLNRLLNEEKAIVSEIAGTTRDSIEDTIQIGGMLYRFIDTAGLRHTTDSIENLGIERAYVKISQALIVILLVDLRESAEGIIEEISQFNSKLKENQKLLILLNKVDLVDAEHLDEVRTGIASKFSSVKTIELSAKHRINLEKLTSELVSLTLANAPEGEDTIITNARHYESLLKAHENLVRVVDGLENNLSGDLLALDIRQVLHYIGEITGEVTTDEVLGNIFSKFCIGK